MTVVLLGVAFVAFGLFTGVVAALLGIGGGIMIVPFLAFAAGLPQHEAEATSLLVILPTAIAASLVLRRRGVGDLGRALVLGAVGAAGAAGGAELALALPAATLRLVFAGFLALSGLRLVRDVVRDRWASK